MELSNSHQQFNVLKIRHLRILRIFLWSVGAWSGDTLDQKLLIFIRYYLRIQLPVQSAIVLIGEINYFVQNFKVLEFFDMGDLYITAFLTFLTFFRGMLPNFKQYGIIAKQFFFSFHLIHFKHKGYYFLEMYYTIHRISHYFTLITVGLTIGGMMFFNISPLYSNYRNGVFANDGDKNYTLKFSVYYIYPGYDPKDHFFKTTFVNFFLSYCCATLVCFIDLLLILMVFQIIGHILVLSHNLKNMPRPKLQVSVEGDSENNRIIKCDDRFDDEENSNIRKQISEFVEHHLLIVSFTDLSSFFGILLACNYSYHLVSCCLLLLECSTGDMDAIARYGPLTILTFGQLIQISVIFETVNTVSEKLKDSVYEMPWECMNLSNQRSVCFMLSRMQTPINFTAMGMTSVGVQTMAGILKTTFSYFTFLRSMN